MSMIRGQALGYYRVSSKRQLQGFSIAAQKEAVHACCERLSLQLGFEAEDVKTGTNLNRPGMQSIIKAIDTNEFRYLVVYRYNRLSRHVQDFNRLVDLCDQHDVTVISVQETAAGGTDSVTNVLTRQIFSIMAEFEINTIVENQASSFHAMLNSGLPMPHQMPTGYLYRRGKKPMIDPKNAPVIRATFENYINGQMGIYRLTNKIKREFGRDFNPMTVRHWLINPVYYGHYVTKYGVREDIFPAIITKATFDEAQRVRLNHRAKRFPNQSWLKGKAVCPVCGRRLVRIQHSGGNKHVYWVCDHGRTGYFGIPEEQFESGIQNTLKELFDINQVTSRLQAVFDQRWAEEDQLAANSNQALKQSKVALFNRFEHGDIDAEAFAKEMSGFTDVKPKTLSQAQKDERARLRTAITSISQLSGDTTHVLGTVIDHITVGTNKQVTGVFFKVLPNINVLKLTK